MQVCLVSVGAAKKSHKQTTTLSRIPSLLLLVKKSKVRGSREQSLTCSFAFLANAVGAKFSMARSSWVFKGLQRKLQSHQVDRKMKHLRKSKTSK